MDRLENFKMSRKYNLIQTPTFIPEPKLKTKAPRLSSQDRKIEKITNQILKDSEYNKDDWMMVYRMVSELEKIGQ